MTYSDYETGRDEEPTMLMSSAVTLRKTNLLDAGMSFRNSPPCVAECYTHFYAVGIRNGAACVSATPGTDVASRVWL